MVIHGAKITNFNITRRISPSSHYNLVATAQYMKPESPPAVNPSLTSSSKLPTCLAATASGLLAAAFVCLTPLQSIAIQPQQLMDSDSTLSNVPQSLSSDDGEIGNKRKNRIQRPKSRMAESCTGKCVGTCVRGGYNAPGEGPLNIRRPLVVFKDTFRSRHYCLVECSDICNLIKDGDDGP